MHKDLDVVVVVNELEVANKAGQFLEYLKLELRAVCDGKASQNTWFRPVVRVAGRRRRS